MTDFRIAFIDLTHTGTVIDANNFPLGAAYIAAATRHAFGDRCEIEVFKYPSKLTEYLDRTTPDVVAFSNYMWNERISLTYAAAIKQRHPQVVSIFGGPNYPVDPAEQEAWLRANPQVDFYIDGEGELAFLATLQALLDSNLQISAIKEPGAELPGNHYVDGERFVRGPMVPRILDLDENIPSPYLMGLMDEFFDGKLTPLVQTTRGCPYSCTFCHDGTLYMNKTRRFSKDRIEGELFYIRDRVNVPGLILADLNWGMFPEDIDTARTLAEIKAEHNWPKLVGTATAKNQKERVIEMARMLGDSMHVGASIQSTDADVLKNIKRSNIGFDAIVKMAKESRMTRASSFSEIILCLPGDTKEKHVKSICDMLDANIQDMRCHQFILLPGTEADDPASRDKYEYATAFRVLPRCFGKYEIYEELVPIAEIHEVCVGNNTMPHEDYQACRWFDLSLSIFNNGKIAEEVLTLVEVLGGRRSSLIQRIHGLATADGSPVRGIYDDFRADEDRNFWEDKQTLVDFLASPRGVDAYLAGEYGSNEIFKYRAMAVFTKLEAVLDIILEAARAEIAEAVADEQVAAYLEQLRTVIMARRSAVTEVNKTFELDVNFDFVTLDRASWTLDPRAVWSATPRKLLIHHSPERRKILNSYFRQYGSTFEGLMYLIHRELPNALYREIAGVAA